MKKRKIGMTRLQRLYLDFEIFKNGRKIFLTHVYSLGGNHRCLRIYIDGFSRQFVGFIIKKA